jgi:hypothetical protein
MGVQSPCTPLTEAELHRERNDFCYVPAVALNHKERLFSGFVRRTEDLPEPQAKRSDSRALR